MSDQHLMGIDDLSPYLIVLRSTVYTLVRAGSSAEHEIGRHRRFSREAFERWLQDDRVA